MQDSKEPDTDNRARNVPMTGVAFLIMWRTSVLIIWHIWLDLGRLSSGLPDD